jgi:hypothetical protein
MIRRRGWGEDSIFFEHVKRQLREALQLDRPTSGAVVYPEWS